MFTIDSRQFKNMLSLPGKVVSPRSSLPVLGCVLIETKQSTLSISASNLERYVQNRATVISDQDISICVPFSLLETAIAMSSGTMEIDVVKDKIVIRTDNKKSKIALNGIDPQEFPSMFEVTDKFGYITFAASYLKNVTDHISFACVRDDAMPVFDSICLKVIKSKDDSSIHVRLETTDGFRGVVYDFAPDVVQLSDNLADLVGNSELNAIQLALIPSYISKMIQNLNTDAITLAVDLENFRMVIETEDTTIGSVLVNANFPELEAVIPWESKLVGGIVVSADDVRMSIKRCLLFKREISFVKAEIDGDTITFSAEGDSGKTQTVVECDNVGSVSAFTFGFEGKYMIEQMESLSAIDPNIKLRFVSASAPIVFIPADSLVKYTGVMMPKHMS